MDAPRPKNTVDTEARDYVEHLPLVDDEEEIARAFAEFFLSVLEARQHPSLKVFGTPS